MTATFISRIATEDDLPAMRAVMAASIRDLQAAFLSAEQIEASTELMGLDTQLVADRTYLIIDADNHIAGCGGWSRRATLFGGDHTSGRDARLLDPAYEPARIRAMYTHPAFARRGVGRMIIEACEAMAAREGFTRFELMATLAGEPLYRACGYRAVEQVLADTTTGVQVPLIRMEK